MFAWASTWTTVFAGQLDAGRQLPKAAPLHPIEGSPCASRSPPQEPGEGAGPACAHVVHATMVMNGHCIASRKVLPTWRERRRRVLDSREPTWFARESGGATLKPLCCAGNCGPGAPHCRVIRRWQSPVRRFLLQGVPRRRPMAADPHRIEGKESNLLGFRLWDQ